MPMRIEWIFLRAQNLLGFLVFMLGSAHRHVLHGTRGTDLWRRGLCGGRNVSTSSYSSYSGSWLIVATDSGGEGEKLITI